ncbi:MAG: beta-lactamase family protein [Caldimicrobium sp.]|nr:beta-lactamase family protein [Caldimicrobium sp.]MCX7613079.1 beta-lactamase family protein [Caldimicrobium sp.]MDW8182661.1 serine hydrolase domain-containing protein [Caldimicrobium sp.]
MRRVAVILDLLKEAVNKGIFPGAVAGIYYQGSTYIISAGYASITPFLEPLEEDMLYDLASLTKPLAMGITLMDLMSKSSFIDIEKPLEAYLPISKPVGKVPLFRFLNHTSGLRAWHPFYEEGPISIESLFHSILELPLEFSPGNGCLYSDLNFYLLNYFLEYLFKEPFEALFEKALSRFNLNKRAILLFRPLKKEIDQEKIVPTSVDPATGKILRGIVEDENTRALSGVSGSAGLFGNIYGVLNLLEELLWIYEGKAKGINREVCDLFLNFHDPVSDFTLAFMKPSRNGYSATGEVFSEKTVGHLSYTGCSFFMDLERSLIVVLLTNRVHPFRGNDTIKEFRPIFHRRVVEALQV